MERIDIGNVEATVSNDRPKANDDGGKEPVTMERIDLGNVEATVSNDRPKANDDGGKEPVTMERIDLGNAEAGVSSDRTKANDDRGKKPVVVPMLSSKYRIRGGVDFDDGNGSGVSFDLETRKEFVSKVYLILTLMFVISCFIACFFIFVDPIKEWAYDYFWVMYIFLVAFLILFILVMCIKVLRRRVPLNIILVIILAILQGFIIGFISAGYKTLVILIAFGITIVLCIALSLLARCIPWDLTNCTMLLLVIVVVFWILGTFITLIVLLTRIKVLLVIYAAIGVLVYSIFLIVDTQLLMAGKRGSLDEEEYIMGALTLYVDVIGLFLYILILTRSGFSD